MNDYFKSKRAMYIFALIRMDGLNRADTLGISDEMCRNKRKALTWYTRIKNIVEKKHDQDTNNAIEVLDRLYKNMIDY